MKFKIKSILSTLAVSLMLIVMASCDDNLIFEKEGDCSPKVQFVFKKHRQALHQIPGRESDAFYSVVKSVHLFVYDLETGELVFDKAEDTENLSTASELNLGTGNERCFMNVDLGPGRYRMVAWGGLDATDENNAFRLKEGSRAAYSHCEVKLAEEGKPVNDYQYDALYHGAVWEVEVKSTGNGTQIIPVELTKNTNDINIWVQHTSQTFEKGDYEVVYTDSNGTMHFEDNSLTDPSVLEYHPHAQSLLTSDTEYNGSLVKTGALIAHVSTSRLLANHSDARLEVRDREGNTVFSVPFIKYVLEMQTFVKPQATKSDGRDYQYYLDCEDTYNCTFYLTGDREENGAWVPAMIIINNWVKVPDQKEEI